MLTLAKVGVGGQFPRNLNLSRVVFLEKNPAMMAASIFPPKIENIATAKTFHSTPVVDPGEAPPLLLDQTEARRVDKNFLDTLS